jgi:exosortase/archaeosortase family protein
MKKKQDNNDSRVFEIPIRYLILLGFILSLPGIYKIFTPLTVYPTAYILDLFYNVIVNQSIITINNNTFIHLIPACIAGSAYLLLLILNLTVPMGLKKRIYSILLSFLILLVLNIIRIVLLSVLYHHSVPFFDFTHTVFWFALSTIFVIGIWFYIVKLFSIKEIPVYSDIKTLIKR